MLRRKHRARLLCLPRIHAPPSPPFSSTIDFAIAEKRVKQSSTGVIRVSRDPFRSRKVFLGRSRPMEEYERIKSLGEGSYGKVFLARQKRDGALVCVKAMSMGGLSKKEREACHNEASLLKRMSHPNICAFLGSFMAAQGATLCIVMAFCDGGDLNAAISKGPARGEAAKRRQGRTKALFSESVVLGWFVQLALGLHYLHVQKVLHRDIKSQNAFVLSSGRLVLGDLGISKVLDGTHAMAKTAIGTPFNMAPEVFDNRPYSFESDVWSLGCVLYEMCAREMPFGGGSMAALMRNIMAAKCAPLDRGAYSAELQEMLSAMLSKRPESRPTMAALLQRPLLRKHLRKQFVAALARTAAQRSGGALQIPEDMPVTAGTIDLGAALRHVSSERGGGMKVATTAAAKSMVHQLNQLGLRSLVKELMPAESSEGGGDGGGATPLVTARGGAKAAATGSGAAASGAARAPRARGAEQDLPQRLLLRREKAKFRHVGAALENVRKLKLDVVREGAARQGAAGAPAAKLQAHHPQPAAPLSVADDLRARVADQLRKKAEWEAERQERQQRLQEARGGMRVNRKQSHAALEQRRRHEAEAEVLRKRAQQEQQQQHAPQLEPLLTGAAALDEAAAIARGDASLAAKARMRARVRPCADVRQLRKLELTKATDERYKKFNAQQRAARRSDADSKRSAAVDAAARQQPSPADRQIREQQPRRPTRPPASGAVRPMPVGSGRTGQIGGPPTPSPKKKPRDFNFVDRIDGTNDGGVGRFGVGHDIFGDETLDMSGGLGSAWEPESPMAMTREGGEDGIGGFGWVNPNAYGGGNGRQQQIAATSPAAALSTALPKLSDGSPAAAGSSLLQADGGTSLMLIRPPPGLGPPGLRRHRQQQLQHTSAGNAREGESALQVVDHGEPPLASVRGADEALRLREQQLEEAFAGSARTLKQLRVQTTAGQANKQRRQPVPRAQPQPQRRKRTQGTGPPTTMTIADEDEAVGFVIHSVEDGGGEDDDEDAESNSDSEEDSDNDADFYMKLMAHKFRDE